MDVAQFKKLLALYGADSGRWEGVDIDEVKALIRNSEEARALYKQAGALDNAMDTFAAGAPDAALLDKVMRRIDATAAGDDMRQGAAMEVPAGLAFRHMNMRMAWGAGLACALVIAVVAGLFAGKGAEAPGGNGAAVVAAQDSAPQPETRVAGAEEIDAFLAELSNMAQEERTEQEIIGMLAAAGNRPERARGSGPQNSGDAARAADEDIDAFLDRLFSDMQDDPALQQEMDMWQLFLESGSQEL